MYKVLSYAELSALYCNLKYILTHRTLYSWAS